MSDSLETRLGRIEGKLDSFIAELGRDRDQADDLEGRVSSLERSRAWLVGAAAVLAAAFTHGVNAFLGKGH